MRQHRFREEKHGENVRAKCSFELARRDFGDAFLRMLLGGVVDQNVDSTQLPFRLRNRRAAKTFIPDVPGNQNAAPSLRFHEPLGFPGVLVFLEVNYGNIRPFLRVEHRHGPADPAVAAGNQGNSVPQLSRPNVIARAGFRLWPHLVLAARLAPLMLWWTDFFLFGHGENESILAGPPDAAIRRKNFCKKMHFGG